MASLQEVSRLYTGGNFMFLTTLPDKKLDIGAMISSRAFCSRIKLGEQSKVALKGVADLVLLQLANMLIQSTSCQMFLQVINLADL